MAGTELLGICVVYLGGLNYFFAVDEKTPIVSKIGTPVGELHVQITPYTATASASTTAPRSTEEQKQAQSCDSSSSSHDGFVRYERQELDAAEEQVYEHMDRTLQFRVRVNAIRSLQRSRKFSHVYVRYSFFKAGSAQTEHRAIAMSQPDDEDGAGTGGEVVQFRHERRFAVDVNDAFVKYVTSNSLTLESESALTVSFNAAQYHQAWPRAMR